MRGRTFFARTNQMHGLKPNVHRNVAFLKYRVDFDSKWLPTGVALVDAEPGAFTLQQSTFPDYSAVRAEAAIFPNDFLDIGVSGLFVAEAGLIEDGIGHIGDPYLTDRDYISSDLGTSSPISSPWRVAQALKRPTATTSVVRLPSFGRLRETGDQSRRAA